jgi:hypothetical protein
MTEQEYIDTTNFCYVKTAIGVMSQYICSDADHDPLAGNISATLYGLYQLLEKQVNAHQNEDANGEANE